MKITGIGINADAEHIRGDLDVLERDLAFFQVCGFDTVELALPGLDLIVNGVVRTRQLERVRQIIEKFPFTYTVHAEYGLNLAFGANPSFERQVFVSTLDICAALGAKTMVYHSGLMALEMVRVGLAMLPDRAQLERGREREVELLIELMPLAADCGVMVAMENRDPHTWEIALLAREGLTESDLSCFHEGLLIDRVLEQIRAVNHPNLGLCLDLAHLYLATGCLGHNYLDTVAKAIHHTRHLHISDNFGKFLATSTEQSAMLTYGQGDLHLPPGWGGLPISHAFARLEHYEGAAILEIHPRYQQYSATAREFILSVVANTVPEPDSDRQIKNQIQH